MTTGTEQEPTLRDVLNKLNSLTNDVEGLKDTLTADVEGLKDNVERFNERFSNYQQATQWVVQLAFTLIVSATVTVIVTSVLHR